MSGKTKKSSKESKTSKGNKGNKGKRKLNTIGDEELQNIKEEKERDQEGEEGEDSSQKKKVKLKKLDLVVQFLIKGGLKKNEANEIHSLNLFNHRQEQILLEIINLYREKGFQDTYDFVKSLGEKEKNIESIVFMNPTLDPINKELKDMEQFMREKPIIREGVFECGRCKTKNTSHYTVANSGDEAAKVFRFCNQCRLGF